MSLRDLVKERLEELCIMLDGCRPLSTRLRWTSIWLIDNMIWYTLLCNEKPAKILYSYRTGLMDADWRKYLIKGDMTRSLCGY